MYFNGESTSPKDYQGWYKATWNVKRNGEVIHGADSVYLEPGGVGTLEIRY